MNKIFIVIFSLLLVFYISPQVIAVSSKEEYAKNLFERFNKDLLILDRINEAADKEDWEEFFFLLKNKQNTFQESYIIYRDRPPDLDVEMVNLGQKLEKASAKTIDGIDFLFSLPEDYTDEDLWQGMTMVDAGFMEYSAVAEEVSRLIEEYKTTRSIYLYGTIFGVVGFILFLVAFIIMPKETIEGIGKRAVLKLILKGFGSIALGFGITFATYELMPDTYFIFWGLPIVGGYEILKGLSLYFKYRNNWALILAESKKSEAKPDEIKNERKN